GGHRHVAVEQRSGAAGGAGGGEEGQQPGFQLGFHGLISTPLSGGSYRICDGFSCRLRERSRNSRAAWRVSRISRSSSNSPCSVKLPSCTSLRCVKRSMRIEASARLLA